MVGDEAKFFIPERRLVHLDLKGGPPKVRFKGRFTKGKI